MRDSHLASNLKTRFNLKSFMKGSPSSEIYNRNFKYAVGEVRSYYIIIYS